MKTSFEYRSYVIDHDGSAFTATSADGEPFQLRSKNILRVTRAIDGLWNALEGKIPLPGWFLIADEVVDIDAASSESMLIVDRPTANSNIQSLPVAVPAAAVA
jgi:hypothetical protein